MGRQVVLLTNLTLLINPEAPAPYGSLDGCLSKMSWTRSRVKNYDTSNRKRKLSPWTAVSQGDKMEGRKWSWWNRLPAVARGSPGVTPIVTVKKQSIQPRHHSHKFDIFISIDISLFLSFLISCHLLRKNNFLIDFWLSVQYFKLSLVTIVELIKKSLVHLL